MFREWGYLLGEIWILLALAALLGLLAGWLIWGGRKNNAGAGDRLRAELDACRKAGREADDRIAVLQADLDTARTKVDAAGDVEGKLARLRAELEACEADRSSIETALTQARARQHSGAATAAAFAAMPRPEAPVKADDSFVNVGRRPAGLSVARGGKADDLKLVSGIGPKLEKLCNSLGFYHFDQIAAWTQEEIEWVDENLEGFKGRVTRDDWVGQAKLLAQGIMPKK